MSERFGLLVRGSYLALQSQADPNEDGQNHNCANSELDTHRDLQSVPSIGVARKEEG
jgi:hypothetical protein